ncbi:MAG: helix-turn-helix transcriptional regulator [Coriobacteriales bacterium]|jgi:DNA-binding XRE family transcriptional regulator|nr:helix-turn-helix transcriptional regulator [Coriobacteriales bacterium]
MIGMTMPAQPDTNVIMPVSDPLTKKQVFDASEIGMMLRQRRKELGYTQVDIASFMGISPRLVGEIERGRKTVGIQKVLNMASGLGIDIFLSVRGR